MGRFIAAFAILFVLELAVIIKVGSSIGAFATLTAMFAFMVIGAILVKLRIRQALLELQNNQQPSLHILWLPVSGFFFIFPGFISDVIGALLLLPPVQHFIESKLKNRAQASFSSGRADYTRSTSSGRTIEGSCTEVSDEKLTNKNKDDERS